MSLSNFQSTIALKDATKHVLSRKISFVKVYESIWNRSRKRRLLVRALRFNVLRSDSRRDKPSLPPLLPKGMALHLPRKEKH